MGGTKFIKGKMVQKNFLKLEKLKKINFKKLKKIPWSFNQPLSKAPPNHKFRISDLFVWIKNSEIQTFYEFMDLPSLFEDNEVAVNSLFTLIIFDKKGEILKKIKIKSKINERFELNLNDYLQGINAGIGTFSIFHNNNPEKIKSIGSFISDRGYVKYYVKKLKIFKYVHGNLDAIAYDDNNIINLGANSFLLRKYYIQYQFKKNNIYRFYLVNFSKSKKLFHLYNYIGNNLINSIQIEPSGCDFFEYKCKNDDEVLFIKSKLVMARPMIYVANKSDEDFFHG